MQKIVLFFEPQQQKYDTPLKIGNLFINRFGIDEASSHEIIKIYYLEHTATRQVFLQGMDCKM